MGVTGRHQSGGDEEAAEGGSQSSGEYDDYFEDVLQPLDLEAEEESGSESGGGEDPKRVEDLLAKLKADPRAQPPPPSASKRDGSKAKEEERSDDDSEGEAMSREVENVICRAMDELKLDRPANQPADPDAPFSPNGERKADDGQERAPSTVPQDAAHNKERNASPKEPQEGADKDGNDGEAGLSLPTVPTKLIDPAPALGPGPPDDGGDEDSFESLIAARLAALKGAAAPIHTDALGLPSAPTFQPEDNQPAPKTKARRGGDGRVGYTDADQKTWCIVCLEDGTIRCRGCDDEDNVYCARCWKEMHVGPSAGYDERGHAWEKFDPRRV